MSTSTKQSQETQYNSQNAPHENPPSTPVPKKRPRSKQVQPDPYSHASPNKPPFHNNKRPRFIDKPIQPIHLALGIQSQSSLDPSSYSLPHQRTDLTQIQVPPDIQVPSPPSSTSSSSSASRDRNQNSISVLETSHHIAQPIRYPVITDTYNPPHASQESACPSFSHSNPDDNNNSITPSSSKTESKQVAIKTEQQTEEIVQNSNHDSHETKKRKPYYARAFDYVITHILERYSHILDPDDIELATLAKNHLSDNAQALFVRIYRRKQPQWFRVAQLEQSYDHELDVDSAVTELCQNRLLISSLYAARTLKKYAVLLAKEVVKTLDVDELKKVAKCTPEGKSLIKLSKSKLLPAIENLLGGNTMKEKTRGKKLKQTTLSGISPTERLTLIILETAGHSIRIPQYILISLERIHFLFFLEDGHDSPNIILADTGKTKFPNYRCETAKPVFSSSHAFQAFRDALELEKNLNEALETKDYAEAAHLGSLAEAEVKQFVNENSGVIQSEALSMSANPSNQVLLHREDSEMRRMLRRETLQQLEHPFFRRYTAQWVFVRATWHSVHALERLGEHSSAVERLRLLLSTDLMAKRRGKCLNRLTINLSSHLQRLEEPLQVIVSELQLPSNHLNFGDRLALARRGLTIYRKLEKAVKKPKRKSRKSKSSDKMVSEEREASSSLAKPEILFKTLKDATAQISIRKILGKSLNVQMREKNESLDELKDPWQHFTNENSRESYASAASQSFSVMGKSVFESFRSAGGKVSVEQYCLEWYYAKERWEGIHDEGGSIRFLFSIFLWECALFASVPDVFQTPYQDRPLDLFTEVFFSSRRKAIEERLSEIEARSADDLYIETEQLYDLYSGTRAIGCSWNNYTSEALATIAAGLGGKVLARCFRLLAQDYSYWAGGLPDLTLWRVDNDNEHVMYHTRLVEVKSARDILSERQKAWLIELKSQGGECEVCKVVENETANNAAELGDAKLESVDIDALNARSETQEVK